MDLNPVRAKITPTPESSNHTSIQYRINTEKAGKATKFLMPFVGNPRKDMPHGLPFKLTDYISLVDITGRCIAKNKKGSTQNSLPDILKRLDINKEQWLKLTTQFESCFHHAAGNTVHLETYKDNHNLTRLKDKTNAQKLFG